MVDLLLRKRVEGAVIYEPRSMKCTLGPPNAYIS